MLGGSTEVLQPCRVTDHIRLNTAGKKRQKRSKGEGGGGGGIGWKMSEERREGAEEMYVV